MLQDAAVSICSFFLNSIYLNHLNETYAIPKNFSQIFGYLFVKKVNRSNIRQKYYHKDFEQILPTSVKAFTLEVLKCMNYHKQDDHKH